MTDLNRKALVAEMDAIMKRASIYLNSQAPVSAAVAQARYEMAHTLKADIQNGVYDLPVSPPTEPIATGLDTPKSKRSPWTWPLVALSALLIIVLGGTLAALFL